MYRKWFGVAVLSLVLFGCSAREYAMFQDENVDRQIAARKHGLLKTIFPPHEENANAERITPAEKKLKFGYEAKILPGDTLQIAVYNHSRKIRLSDIDTFAGGTHSAGATPVTATPAVSSGKQEYLVDTDGTVYLPLLHDVSIASMTEREASALLTRKYRAYLTDPKVKVHIGNTRVYVLGEVNKPGILPVHASGATLYEIIAKSGDLTDYADRRGIKIISGPLGNQTMRYIDMTHMASLNATNLMIAPNSIVYVPPKGTKAVKVAIDDYMPILQLLTTTMGAYLSIDYLINGRD